jgi:2-polyprenyl-3-methyl-5-hydroxy-6-metoxy-1,4-benzoquinol methylase
MSKPSANPTQQQRVSICMENTLHRLDQKPESETRYSVTASDLLIEDYCPVCASKKLDLISDVTMDGLIFFATSACTDCNHVFRSTAPNRNWFQQRWKQIATGELEVFNPTLELDRLHRYRLYYTLLSRYRRSGKLLDVGAAYGSGANFLKERGWDVEALEVEDDRANYIREKLGITVHHQAVEDLELPKDSMDVILFAHCLEHLDDPRLALKKLASWLNPEHGLIYLEVPILWTIVDWRDAFFMAHKHNFVEEGLAKLVEECGLFTLEKFLVPDMETGIANFGMLLSRNKAMQVLKDPGTLLPASTEANAIRKLYTSGMPIEWKADATAPLHYHVPYMNHFYYIVRMQQGEWKPVSGQPNHFAFERNPA